jgi:hypothetical protein
VISFDSSLLLGYYQAKTAGGRERGCVGRLVLITSSASKKGGAQRALDQRDQRAQRPGQGGPERPQVRRRKRGASAARTISGDYKKLFAAYQALNTLSAIANRGPRRASPTARSSGCRPCSARG